MNFRNIQRESLLFMSSAELFLGNIAQTSAVAQGDVQVTADKSAAARRSWRRGRLAGAGRRHVRRSAPEDMDGVIDAISELHQRPLAVGGGTVVRP